jgi:hypothetical protein
MTIVYLRLSDADSSSSGESEDSQQPSGKTTRHSRVDKGTVMTPAASNSKIVRRTLMDNSDQSSSYRSTHSKSIHISREEEKTDLFGFLWGFLAIVVVVGSVLLAAGFYDPSEEFGFLGENEEYWNQTKRSFRQELSSLKREFVAQDDRSWAIIASSVLSILKSDPVQPSVLLFVSTNAESKSASECLAFKVAELGSGVLGKRAPGRASDALDYGTKNELFDAMDTELGYRGSFVLRGLQSLTGDVAMALHAFCDNLNAPHKQAVIAMSVDVADFSDLSWLSANVESAVEKALTDKWEDRLDVDRISPILSRITVSVVNVRKEEKDICL